ncbi:two-component system sensor histidine kinase DesK [Saccharothrix tamanrassetensis]|uniref:Two-component system sensor histidine kinase DesK n=1 Tax=Saccharothrix tamanrassetensis TaxID=1051531 RepID=A0A841CVS3_9PSEU|nr:histidine kinase [Saccharothrix tamanrassetensis]MBB5960238.1 two-component system sensor histidine kinase DesK [Saccharothrix tamanrassetensis]
MTQISTLRRWTWWSVVGAGVMVALVTTLDMSTGRYGWGTVGLASAVVVVSVQHARYLRQAMDGLGRGGRRTWEHLATFAVAIGALAYAGTQTPVPMAWYLLPAAVIAHVVANRPAGTRWVVVLGGMVAAILAGGVLTSPEVVESLLMPVFLVSGFVLADLAQLWFWDAVLRIDQGRQASEALVVAEERLRFAADLHDIQGHHLQAIALKGELTARLIGRDDAAARRHAEEVAELARTALRETREVVQGYRRASLGTEITNAVGVLRAAGIETAVSGDATDVPPPLQPLFGALVREGTTNVLRHSRARRCDVDISVVDGRVVVRLRNDGVRSEERVRPGSGVDEAGGGTGWEGETGSGSGLAGLRERFASVGGRIEVGAAGADGFELVGLVRS